MTASNWTTATANTTSYQLTGLSGLTEYQVRVKADCGSETSSYKSTTFTTPNCPASDACEYTFVLADGYGDGWNGGSLALQQGGVAIATLQAAEHGGGGSTTYDTVHLVLCDNIATSLVWTSGTYDDEVSFTILGPDGTQIYTYSDMTAYTTHTFTTDCSNAPGPGPDPCNTPTGLHTTDVQNESIAIAWDANPNVNSWNVQYRLANGSWNSASATTNSYTITGLTGNKDYEIEVQAVCANGTSDWSASITAHTTNVGIENWLENNVTLFPNPAKEYVDIRVDGDLNVTAMEVYDVYGKLINTVNVIDNPTRINVNGLADGMYFVRVTTEAGVVTKTFVKK